MLRVQMYVALLSTFIFILLAEPTRADDTAQLVEVVIGLLGDNDKDMRALGLEQVRAASPGEAATKAYAAVLPKLSPATQVGLLKALTVRGDNAARSAVVSLLSTTKLGSRISRSIKPASTAGQTSPPPPNSLVDMI